MAKDNFLQKLLATDTLIDFSLLILEEQLLPDQWPKKVVEHHEALSKKAISVVDHEDLIRKKQK